MGKMNGWRKQPVWSRSAQPSGEVRHHATGPSGPTAVQTETADIMITILNQPSRRDGAQDSNPTTASSTTPESMKPLRPTRPQTLMNSTKLSGSISMLALIAGLFCSVMTASAELTNGLFTNPKTDPWRKYGKVVITNSTVLLNGRVRKAAMLRGSAKGVNAGPAGLVTGDFTCGVKDIEGYRCVLEFAWDFVDNSKGKDKAVVVMTSSAGTKKIVSLPPDLHGKDGGRIGIKCDPQVQLEFILFNPDKKQKYAADPGSSLEIYNLSADCVKDGNVDSGTGYTNSLPPGRAARDAVDDKSKPQKDANRNSIPDYLDILERTSQDRDNNGVPDEADLSLSLTDAGLAVSWPDSFLNEGLESSWSLFALAWSPVGALPSVTGDHKQVIVPADGQSQFFRLSYPPHLFVTTNGWTDFNALPVGPVAPGSFISLPVRGLQNPQNPVGQVPIYFLPPEELGDLPVNYQADAGGLLVQGGFDVGTTLLNPNDLDLGWRNTKFGIQFQALNPTAIAQVSVTGFGLDDQTLAQSVIPVTPGHTGPYQSWLNPPQGRSFSWVRVVTTTPIRLCGTCGPAITGTFSRPGGDTTPPELVAAGMDLAGDRLIVTFSEPVDRSAALVPLHYTLTGGSDQICIRAVEWLTSTAVALIPDAPLQAGRSYMLSASGVSDLASNVMPANGLLITIPPQQAP